MESNGEKYSGNYELNDTDLSINILDENKKEISLVVKDIEKSSENNSLYAREISQLNLDENHKLNHQLSNFSVNEYLGFFEN